MQVRECMSRDVKIATPEATLRDAATMMAECDAGVLPVGENDRLVGMVTDRDIAIRGIGKGMGPDAKVRDVMSAEVKYCRETDDADEVLRNMGDIQVRRLPVVDDGKRLVGIVSLSDFATNGQAAPTGDALGEIARPGGEHNQSLSA